jgi:hypothetical protein
MQSGLTPDGLLWVFGATYAEFRHPLTWLSLMFDYQLSRFAEGLWPAQLRSMAVGLRQRLMPPMKEWIPV